MLSVKQSPPAASPQVRSAVSATYPELHVHLLVPVAQAEFLSSQVPGVQDPPILLAFGVHRLVTESAVDTVVSQVHVLAVLEVMQVAPETQFNVLPTQLWPCLTLHTLLSQTSVVLQRVALVPLQSAPVATSQVRSDLVSKPVLHVHTAAVPVPVHPALASLHEASFPAVQEPPTLPAGAAHVYWGEAT